jgi:divalent metal cation (Fe/Co/Zn/Cd) transporter
MHYVEAPTSNSGFPREHAHAALVVSVQSVVWTTLSGAASITLGFVGNSAVLVAFGSIGWVDAVGSIALVRHFRHGLRNHELSDDLERLAHQIVLVGLMLVGCAAIVGGLARLATHKTGDDARGAALLAAVSMVSLALLSVRKRQIARRVSSSALRSDAHLSGVGATQAAVALVGTAAAQWFGWHSADAETTAVIGCVAVAVAARTWWSTILARPDPIIPASQVGADSVPTPIKGCL